MAGGRSWGSTDVLTSPTRAHVPHAGGLFPGLTDLPPDAPSRAYLKIEEVLHLLLFEPWG